MWLILQHKIPDDFILATGKSITVREFANKVFKKLNLDLIWTGKKENEKGLCKKTGKILIGIDKNYYRPNEVNFLLGNAKKAKKIFQNVKILKKKNYYLKNIKKELKKKKIKKIKNILYVCGLMNHNKMINKLEKISFFNFFKILNKKYYKILNVVLRYHPAESNFFDQKIIKKLNIKISKNKIIDDFNWSDIVVGANTMTFYVAKSLNLPCYSSVPSKYKMKNIDGSVNSMKFSLLTRKKLFYEN
jgi:hypothetical protein